jgi:hypothetical protein
MASVQAARLGKSVMLIEPTHWIGGMVAGGLSDTDSGNAKIIGGLALEFFQTTSALEMSRGAKAVINGTAFDVEPHVARQVFTGMLAAAGVTYRVDSPLANLQKSGPTLQQITLSDGSAYSAKMFIDSSYEGDLMALAGIPYAVGQEARSSVEPDAGVQVPNLFAGGISSYVTSGVASSGLLPEVTEGPAAAPGSADGNIMAYDYRFCVTDLKTHGSNAIPFARYFPATYSAQNYAAVLRVLNAAPVGESGAKAVSPFFVASAPYADGKIDVNGSSAFSTDVVGIQNGYPDGNRAVRASIAASIQSYDQGLFYFLSANPNVPSSVSSYVNQFGICADEFTDNGNLPTQLYIREARRMQGAYVMTEADVLNKATPVPTDIVGMGGYDMDSHIRQIIDIGGDLYTEGSNKAIIGYGCTTSSHCLVLPGTPFSIPYRALTPAATDAGNLLVTVAISATSTAYRAIRLEPQYMIMGQAAGAAASLAIDNQSSVQDVNYQSLMALLVTPAFAGQPPQVLTPPCALKGTTFPVGKVVIGYKSVANSQTCTTATFTCAAGGVWTNPSNISPVPYYNSCAAATSASGG